MGKRYEISKELTYFTPLRSLSDPSFPVTSSISVTPKNLYLFSCNHRKKFKKPLNPSFLLVCFFLNPFPLFLFFLFFFFFPPHFFVFFFFLFFFYILGAKNFF